MLLGRLVLRRCVWGWRAIASAATVVDLVAVAMLYGFTLTTATSADGWPSDPLALGVGILAAIASLAPIWWIWAPSRRSLDLPPA